MSGEDSDSHRFWRDRRKNGQFKKGVSGNPRGRPRRARSTKAILQEMLASKVAVVVRGQTRNLTVVEAMAERIKREALTGSLRALETAVTIAQKFSLEDSPAVKEEFNYSKLSDEELDELERLLLKAAGSHQPDTGVDTTSGEDHDGQD